MSVSAPDPTALLQDLGFSPVEAAVYCELLKHPGISGYRVARGINKAQGNTYQALASLADKGAVFADGEEPRTYRPVPIKEVISRLRRTFEDRCEAAETSLEALEQRPPEGLIVSLTNLEQVFERASTMIMGAKATVVFESFEDSWRRLEPALKAAAERLGQACAGMVVGADGDELVFGKVNVSPSRVSRRLLDTAPYEQLLVVVDGRELLAAALNRKTGEVQRAIWGNDVLLSYLMHNGLVSDVVLHRSELIEKIASPNRYLLGRLPPTFTGGMARG